MRRWRAAALLLLATASCRAVASGPAAVPVPQDVAAGVALTRIASGLSKPVFLTFAPGDASGRLFIVEQTGTIRILKHGALDRGAPPFLDVSGRVSRRWEQGLLGLAFHPQFTRNRRLL
jgi:hypothetical protein